MIYPTGEIYEGNWTLNQKVGPFIITSNDGNITEKEFYNDIAIENISIVDPNGDVYNGEHVNGCKHGQGTLVYITGGIYKGKWMKDQKHGQGLMTYYNGDTWKGKWNKGVKWTGTMKFQDGRIKKWILGGESKY